MKRKMNGKVSYNFLDNLLFVAESCWVSKWYVRKKQQLFGMHIIVSIKKKKKKKKKKKSGTSGWIVNHSFPSINLLTGFIMLSGVIAL